jgi:hypothetical protein
MIKIGQRYERVGHNYVVQILGHKKPFGWAYIKILTLNFIPKDDTPTTFDSDFPTAGATKNQFWKLLLNQDVPK